MHHLTPLSGLFGGALIGLATAGLMLLTSTRTSTVCPAAFVNVSEVFLLEVKAPLAAEEVMRILEILREPA